jgi:hypothetical protein
MQISWEAKNLESIYYGGLATERTHLPRSQVPWEILSFSQRAL